MDYCYYNVASVFWSVVLLLGGGVFVVYYASIGYMPDFDLKSSVTITAATAATSTIFIVMLLVMTILPGAYWSGFWNMLGSFSNLKKYWGGPRPEKNLLGLMVWFAFPLVFLYMSSFSYFFMGPVSLVFSVVVFLIFLFFLQLWGGFGFRGSLKEMLFLACATFISGALMFTPLHLVFKLSVSSEQDLEYPSWFAGCIAAIFLVLVNVLSAAPVGGKTSVLKNLVLGFMSFLMLVWLFGFSDRIPMAVMNMYKFGNIKTSELVLKREGCELLDGLGVNVSPTEYDICTASDLLILSRLGSESYLEVSNGDSEAMRFTMPSSYIVSWSELVDK